MDFNKEKLPEHIGIIMDGNRRWAKQNGLPKNQGHKEGAKTLEKIVRYANKIGIKYITVYAFSTENWKRAEEEVNSIMLLMQNYLDSYSKRADSENIRMQFLGNLSELSNKMQKSITNCIEKTKNNTGIIFNIALNYGGRAEILKAIKEVVEDVQKKVISVDNITEEILSSHLYTKGQPDPDLIIRTSGEMRLSNFLTWQSVYSELLFIDKHWPEFSEQDLDNSIIEFQKRTRKFGAN